MTEASENCRSVYDRHGISVIHAPALEALSGMADASVDAVVCDPPYGLGNHSPAAVTTALTAWANGDRERVPDGRGFMGQEWDSFVPPPAVWDECLRVLKPGGHLACFAGSRTLDLMTLSVRMAGFEIRDTIAAWLYSSGFAKSLDVGKAIDKRGGNADSAHAIGAAIKAAREARGWTSGQADRHFCGGSTNWSWFEGRKGECRPPTPATFAAVASEWPELAPWAELVAEADREVVGVKSSDPQRFRAFKEQDGRERRTFGNDITTAATDAARHWDGWGTALAPAFEPIILARKPLSGTVAATVLEHGTGGLNIAATRTAPHATDKQGVPQRGPAGKRAGIMGETVERVRDTDQASPDGRWPKNVVLCHHPSCSDDGCADDCHVRALDEQTGTLTSGYMRPEVDRSRRQGDAYGEFSARTATATYGDTGGGSRFFPTFRYEAKAPQSERPRVRATPMLRLRSDLTESERAHVLAELTRAGVDVA